jgi:hypothetical protein
VEANRIEREAYVRSRAFKLENITLIEMDATKILTDEQLALRLRALTLLGGYGASLAALATGETSDAASAQVTEISKQFGDLASSVGASDTKFVSAINGAAPLLQAVLNAMLERKRTAALKQAVTTAHPAVKQVIDVIREDVANLYERRRQAASELRTHYRDAYAEKACVYKNTPCKPDTTGARAAAEQLLDQADQFDTLVGSAPVSALDAMSDANEALKDAVLSDGDGAALQRLADRLNAFAARAQLALQAVKYSRSL